MITSLLLVSIYNFSFWQQLIPIASWSLIVSVFMVMFACAYFLISLISFKYIYKPFLILILFIAALSAYAMDNYGFVVSTGALQNIIETDSNEILDLLSWKLAWYLLILFVLPTIFILKYKFEHPNLKRRCTVLAICMLVVAGNLSVLSAQYMSSLHNHKYVRYYANPFRPLYSIAECTAKNFKKDKNLELALLDASPTRTSDAKPKLVIFVLGEADRAMNHAFNGYDRNTNPLLQARGDIINLGTTQSCGTETLWSVPCMFSAFKRLDYNYNKGRYTENVFDLLQKTGVKVLWRDNNSGCKNVCKRVPTQDLYNLRMAEYCDAYECYDDILLHDIQSYIDQHNGDQIIVLHKMGNHGPAYYHRYPEKFEIFTPTCTSNQLNNCSYEEIRNTYDNIILYTDDFLDRVIKILEANSEQYQTAMIYVSDHGESLGEKGVYLHALPYWMAPKEQTSVPFYVWASPDFSIRHDHLRTLKDQDISHDHVFHSLLGLFKVSSLAYDTTLDIFN